MEKYCSKTYELEIKNASKPRNMIRLMVVTFEKLHYFYLHLDYIIEKASR